MATPEIAPSDRIELDLDPVPSGITIPPWLATVLAAIGAIVPLPAELALETLRALVAPYAKDGASRPAFVALSSALQASFRTAYGAKYDQIKMAPVLASVPASPATERQAIPVVRDAPPALVNPIVRPGGSWVPLMQDGNGRARMATSAERSRKMPPALWGARIEHAPQEPVTVGTLVRVTNARNTRSAVQVVAGIVTSDGLTTIATVREAKPEDTAPRAPLAVGSAPVMRDTRASERWDNPTATAIRTPEAGTIDAALDDIALQGAALAAPRVPGAFVEPTTRGNGEASASSVPTSIPTGPDVFERARLAQGLAPNASARLLRSVSPQALVQGTTPRNEAVPTTERQRLLTERNIIAGAIAIDGWLQVSWTGEGSTTHGAVNDALIAVERESDAPGVPSAEHYAGLAVDMLRGRDWDVKRLHKSQCPAGVKATWLVGRALGGGGRTAVPGDAYGTAELFVDLVAGDSETDGMLRFRGSPTLADQVRNEYTASVASVALTSRVLTPWLGRVLRVRHGAVKRGHCWYVPPGHAMAVRALIGGAAYAARCAELATSDDDTATAPSFDTGSIGALWGDHELINVTTGPDLFSSLCRGLTIEAGRIAIELTTKTTEAREAAAEKARKKASEIRGATEGYITSEGAAAYNRATVSPTIAARLLRDLGSVAARVSGYEAVLGAASVASVKEQIATLRATLEPLTDDTSLRGAMLELS